MIRWLSRYVKRIEVLGIGVELREIPEAEALPLMAYQLKAVVSTKSPDNPVDSDGIVELKQYLRVTGVSASSQRRPRELDLTAHENEIEFHIHDPDTSRTKLWVNRAELKHRIDSSVVPGEIHIPARKSRSESEVVIVIGEEDEVEVQASWWIWVPKNELKAAFEEIGIPTNW